MKSGWMNPGPLRFPVVALSFVLVSAASLGSTFGVLHNFGNSQDGAIPSGMPVADSNEHLFGTTYQGGDSNGGVVYELSPNPDGSWTETIAHSFVFEEGEPPLGGVILDANGSLYGATKSGGPARVGTIFELTPNGAAWTFNLLYDIGADGGLILDSVGNIYGAIGPGDYENGAIGELADQPNGWTYKALYSFCKSPRCPDGVAPQGRLAWDAAGNLYGTTLYGGIFPYPDRCADAFGCGVVFQLQPRPDGTWRYRILHWFGAFIDDGQLPNGGLVVDGKGNIYGSTGVGGPTFTGTLFKLSPHPPGQWAQSTLYAETQLYTFPDCSQGCGPENPLVMDKAGNLYGTAGGGNTSCSGFYCGVVFRLSPQPDGTWKYTVLHKFSGPDGMGPAGITLDANGNLFGTTRAGGQYNLGVAFEITP